MDQAPAAVTQTVNRVVERTIERVVPGETETVVKEVPVIVTEEERIVNVIKASSGSMVRLVGGDNSALGSGFIVARRGIIITSETVLTNVDGTPLATSTIIFSNGQSAPARRLTTSTPLAGAVLLELVGAPPEGLSFEPLEFATETFLPGQTVVALGIPEGAAINVSGGILASIETEGDPATPLTLRTNAINPSNLGGALFNISGEVIGLNWQSGVAVAANRLSEFISSALQ
jgi:S1-C subfamily serine protease